MKFGRCLVCNKSVEKEGYSHKCANEDAHYPGCHKVHIECANRAIEEARNILTEEHLADEWLERWKDKE